MKEETRKMLEKARAGDAEAQYLTGLYYEDKGDVNEAFQWYDRSAMQGFVYGINAVAIYYLKGMAVEADVNKAIALLESIAEELPTAKANLGHIYLEGQGCPQDIQKGIGLLRQAADSGDGLSAFTMGHIRLKGLFGTPVMYKEATGWFEKAYELGIYDSVDFLCDLYEGLYSRGMRDIRKYRLWSDVRKSLEKEIPVSLRQCHHPQTEAMCRCSGRQTADSTSSSAGRRLMSISSLLRHSWSILIRRSIRKWSILTATCPTMRLPIYVG